MKLKYFFISDKDSDGKPLCIVETKEQAKEFVSNRLYIKHLDDYKSWCYFNQRALDNSSWQEFLQNKIDKEELNSFLIGSKCFNKSEIAAVLRMFIGCAPIGCSFESQQEYQYFGEKLLAKKKLADNIAKMAESQLEKTADKFKSAADAIPDEEVDSTEVQ